MYVIGHSARVCETSVGVPCRLFPRWCDDDDDDDDGVACDDAAMRAMRALFFSTMLCIYFSDAVCVCVSSRCRCRCRVGVGTVRRARCDDGVTRSRSRHARRSARGTPNLTAARGDHERERARARARAPAERA